MLQVLLVNPGQKVQAEDAAHAEEESLALRRLGGVGARGVPPREELLVKKRQVLSVAGPAEGLDPVQPVVVGLASSAGPEDSLRGIR